MAAFENCWFEELFEAISHYTWMLDPQGNVVKANKAAQRLMEFDQEKVIGVPLWSAAWRGLSRQNRRILKWAVDQAIIGRSSFHDLEFNRRGKPGLVINFSGMPVLSDDGRVKFIIAEGRDVTAHKRTSDALSQSEARFKTIFEQAEIGILIKGIDGKMLDCNPAFRAMLGYTAEEISRLDYLSITYAADKRRSQKLFNELVSGKRQNYLIEKRYLHKDGRPIWTRIRASLVPEANQQAQFIIAMVENIAAQKEIEYELSELQRRLTHGRELERLRIAQELHDGPLQEIIDITYQIHELAETQTDKAAREQLKNLQDSANQLARAVRVICGELRPPTLAPFGLGKTITAHAHEFQETHPELKIKLDLVDDGQTLSEPVRLVLFRIYQAALNNIMRHAQASMVKIRFRLDEKKAILKVQDNGRGFELPGRWINFARQGHLGIVGARERANEVGGMLTVASSPGKGTLIQAVVPIKEEFTEVMPTGGKK